jgi:4-hydroxybenzoate polyprenyltransferase
MGLLVASKANPNPIHLIYAFLTTFFVILAIYINNDVMDYEFDKINKVNRPIAAGSVTRKQGLVLVLILISSGILLSALINMETLLIATSLFLLGFCYSTPPPRFKSRFFIEHITTALGGFLSCLMGGAIANNISIQVIYLGLVYFMIIFAGTPLFDLPDLKGDMAQKLKSISILYGPKFGIKFSIVGWSLVIVITALTYPYAGFNIITPITVTATCAAFIWIAYSLFNRWQNVNYSISALKKIIFINFITQLSFVLGILKIF